MDNTHIITIAALGPDSGEMLTLGALEAMRQADVLVRRTSPFRRSTRCTSAARTLTSCAAWPRTRW